MPPSRVTARPCPLTSSASSASSTSAETARSEPTMTTLRASSRTTSVTTAEGSASGRVSSSGPPLAPASAAPPSASGQFHAVHSTTVPALPGKPSLDAEIAVATRSAPATGTTVGGVVRLEGETAARGSNQRGVSSHAEAVVGAGSRKTASRMAASRGLRTCDAPIVGYEKYRRGGARGERPRRERRCAMRGRRACAPQPPGITMAKAPLRGTAYRRSPRPKRGA